jgi:hypothetical protein
VVLVGRAVSDVVFTGAGTTTLLSAEVRWDRVGGCIRRSMGNVFSTLLTASAPRVVRKRGPAMLAGFTTVVVLFLLGGILLGGRVPLLMVAPKVVWYTLGMTPTMLGSHGV